MTDNHERDGPEREPEDRRGLLRTAARAAVAAALGGLALTLGLRRRTKNTGYCDYSGRCGGCPVTDDCETFEAMGGEFPAMSGLSRRDFLRCVGLLGLGTAAGAGAAGAFGDDTVFQIDPEKCIQCGRCATHCVHAESAVKAVHVHAICGHCDLCTAFFDPEPIDLNTGAENQLCPTGAVIRTYVEDPYFTYSIDEALCIGCGKCVKGCEMFGNGSMFLQIRHDRCANCNACSIGDTCPSRAIRRVPASTPYLLKKTH